LTRVLLSDGTEAELRPIEPGDRDAFLAFHRALSEESRYLRYFSARRQLPENELHHYLDDVDQRDHAGIVALVGGALVGHALYDRTGSTGDAEVALEVADAFQGRGVGTLMLEELTALARRSGIQRLLAHVLPGNRRMLEVFHDLGYAERATFEDGVIRVALDLGADAEFAETRRARAEHARKQRPEPERS
jgi:RimJ/RimL family protein N-acetyltransferase